MGFYFLVPKELRMYKLNMENLVLIHVAYKVKEYNICSLPLCQKTYCVSVL